MLFPNIEGAPEHVAPKFESHCGGARRFWNFAYASADGEQARPRCYHWYVHYMQSIPYLIVSIGGMYEDVSAVTKVQEYDRYLRDIL